MGTSSPTKRPRIDLSISATLKAIELEKDAPPAAPPRSRLESLPVELLSEVLSYMPTPNDLLNVTRTSRYLCNTLLNSGNVHIWITTRKMCVAGAVPAPPPGWSEPAHAAFIFDGGYCEECGHLTKRMLVSYAVQARLCGNNICRRTFFKNKLILPRSYGPNYQALQALMRKKLPYVEDIKAFGQRSFITHAIVFRYYRKSNYQDVISMHNEAVRTGNPPTSAELEQDPEVMANVRKQEHFSTLATYRANYERQYQSVKSRNVQMVQKFSEKKGWKVAEVMNSPTIKAMLTTANRCITKLPEEDLENMTAYLREEINNHIAKRENARAEHSRQQRRADVEKYYNSLKSDAHTTRILPPLADFRRLPFIMHLLDKDAPTILNELRADGGSQNSALQSDLNSWVRKRRAEFLQLLGYEKWHDPNSDILSPADRINARFLCTLCDNIPRKLDERGSFDFTSACCHHCPNLSKRERRDHVFSGANFSVDLKGKAVIESAARLANVDISVAGADDKLNALGVRFLCKTCPGRIVMPFSRLSGHASRHDIMEIELLSLESSSAILHEAPYERGAKLKLLFKQLGPEDGVKRKAIGKLKAERNGKVFLCRHCLRVDSESAEDGEMLPSKGSQKPLMIDGMVCHMKARHGIKHMGDEDFFRAPVAPTATAPSL